MTDSEHHHIQNLININQDACTFYDTAQKRVSDPALRTTFLYLEKMHEGVVVDLQGFLRSQGVNPAAEVTLAGQVNRYWAELMSTLSFDVDETLVSHLEEAEDRCLHSLKDALNEDEMSEPAKTMLTRELPVLSKCHEQMRSLKLGLKTA